MKIINKKYFKKNLVNHENRYERIIMAERKIKESIKIDINDTEQIKKYELKSIEYMIGSYRDRYTITTNYHIIYLHDKLDGKLYEIYNDVYNDIDSLKIFIFHIFHILKLNEHLKNLECVIRKLKKRAA